MLQPAALYENELKEKFAEITFDLHYQFMTTESHRSEFNLRNDTWFKHEFVSVNSDNEVIGYLEYRVDRDTRNCSGLMIVRFQHVQGTTVFAKDLCQMIDEVFNKFNFHKLSFEVVVGNPAEKMYDRYIEALGGQIVGVFRKEHRLMDGEYYDSKHYEILKENFNSPLVLMRNKRNNMKVKEKSK